MFAVTERILERKQRMLKHNSFNELHSQRETKLIHRSELDSIPGLVVERLAHTEHSKTDKLPVSVHIYLDYSKCQITVHIKYYTNQ